MVAPRRSHLGLSCRRTPWPSDDDDDTVSVQAVSLSHLCLHIVHRLSQLNMCLYNDEEEEYVEKDDHDDHASLYDRRFCMSVCNKKVIPYPLRAFGGSGPGVVKKYFGL